MAMTTWPTVTSLSIPAASYNGERFARVWLKVATTACSVCARAVKASKKRRHALSRRLERPSEKLCDISSIFITAQDASSRGHFHVRNILKESWPPGGNARRLSAFQVARGGPRRRPKHSPRHQLSGRHRRPSRFRRVPAQWNHLHRLGHVPIRDSHTLVPRTNPADN